MTAEIEKSSGTPVVTLVVRRELGPGSVELSWDGRRAGDGVLPDGSYVPELAFPALNRSVRLATSIRLDDSPG